MTDAGQTTSQFCDFERMMYRLRGCSCDFCIAAARERRCLSQHVTELQAANTAATDDIRMLRQRDPDIWQKCIHDIGNEIGRAQRKHGNLDYGDLERLAILTEEVGEAAKCVNHLYVPPLSAMLNVPRETANLRGELVQVAAVAVRWIQAIDARVARGTTNSEQGDLD